MRALVLSGGGAKGAYQVGALMHLLGDLRIPYDIITGISVGSLNGSFVGMYKKGQEVQASHDLKGLWDTVNDRRIFKQRYPILGETLSMMISAVSSKSLYDSTPLQKLIKKRLNPLALRASGKTMRFGAVSMNTGEYREWGEHDKDIVEAVMASSAFPGFFKPVQIEDDYWTDGGIREVVPLRSAIELGATELDVIVLSADKPHRNMDVGSMNVLCSMPIILDAMLDEISDNDMVVSMPASIRVLRPSRSLLDNSLNFDPEKVQENIELGYDEARLMDWSHE